MAVAVALHSSKAWNSSDTARGTMPQADEDDNEDEEEEEEEDEEDEEEEGVSEVTLSSLAASDGRPVFSLSRSLSRSLPSQPWPYMVKVLPVPVCPMHGSVTQIDDRIQI